ncbi:MAG: hypothetical protein ACK5Q1_20070, partial [Limnobacter sp.]
MTSNLMNNPRSNKDANRPWMLSLTLVDKNTAANLYMPVINGGGIFGESAQEYNLGDPVWVVLTGGDG